MISVGQFFTRQTPKLHGTTVNKLSNKYELLEEAAANMLSRVDPTSIIRKARIDNAIYSMVYNYTAPTDLADEDSVLDIRPIGERKQGIDELDATFVREFDIRKSTRKLFTIEELNAVKTLRLAACLTPRTTLARCDSLTLEGTVTAGGDASNLSIDTLDYISENGSIAFDLSGATGNASITFALNTALDLSAMYLLGSLFEWLKFPDADRLNSVSLKFGSSSTKYWSKAVTAAQDRAFESNAWMLLRHDWTTATPSGAPTVTDAAAIDYLQINISYDVGAALSGVKLDSFTAALGEAWEVLYYSNALFRSADGLTYKTVPTIDTDIILLDPDGINILLMEYLKSAAQQTRGRNMKADVDYANQRLEGLKNEKGLYDRFADKHPSQRMIRQEEYYTFGALSGDDD